MGNFDIVYNRKNTKSVKWDSLKSTFQSEEVLPMWIADMDFQVPKEVTEALTKRVQHGIFGYSIVDSEVKQSITNWVHKRHNWQIDEEYLGFSPGVVTTFNMAIQALTQPGDDILIQTPVYTPFYKQINQNGRHVVENPLILKDNHYEIDFNDLEEKLKNGVKTFIFCSPHNPVGRVWLKEELEKIVRLCLKYDVQLISDEIHADLIFPGYTHIPIASLSEELAEKTVTCMSPSKTFNLAGLQASYFIASNETIREKINQKLGVQGHGMLNTLGVTALEAAYEHGESWVDELKEVIQDNYHYVTKMLHEHTDLTVIQSEGTYLVWIDCHTLGLDSDALLTFMNEQAKVGLNAGINYGTEGKTFMRMNIACPKETVREGVNRMIKAVQNLKIEVK